MCYIVIGENDDGVITFIDCKVYTSYHKAQERKEELENNSFQDQIRFHIFEKGLIK